MSGGFAGDRDGDDRAPFAAALKRVPAVVETTGALVGACANGGRLSVPALLPRGTWAQWSALVPGGFD